MSNRTGAWKKTALGYETLSSWEYYTSPNYTYKTSSTYDKFTTIKRLIVRGKQLHMSYTSGKATSTGTYSKGAGSCVESGTVDLNYHLTCLK